MKNKLLKLKRAVLNIERMKEINITKSSGLWQIENKVLYIAADRDTAQKGFTMCLYPVSLNEPINMSSLTNFVKNSATSTFPVRFYGAGELEFYLDEKYIHRIYGMRLGGKSIRTDLVKILEDNRSSKDVLQKLEVFE